MRLADGEGRTAAGADALLVGSLGVTRSRLDGGNGQPSHRSATSFEGHDPEERGGRDPGRLLSPLPSEGTGLTVTATNRSSQADSRVRGSAHF